MAGLIDDLLELSRVTRAQLELKTVDLSSMARNIVRGLEELQPERKVVFSIAPHLTVQADPDLMKIVMENLLNNAWKFTGKEPRARIEFGQEQGGGRENYFVRDNGAGFDMGCGD